MYDLIDSKILDKNAEYYNVNLEVLMENAGKSVAQFCGDLGKKFLVLCGPGNNGGDGYVAAKYLKHMGKDVYIKVISPPETSLAIKKKSECDSAGIKYYNGDDYDSFDVLVDAILGVGIKGVPREPFYSEIVKINNSKSRKVSVDVPSGFPSSHHVKPEFTVTMQFLKKGMVESECGRIIVADIGFPPDAIKYIGPGEILAFPKNQPSSHKGDNGILLVISGSQEYYGSAVYAIKSALRMGIDLLYLFTPRITADRISSNVYDIILREAGEKYFEIVPQLLEMIRNKNIALAIGPGISKERTALNNIRKVITASIQSRRPMVIDADPLTITSEFNFENLTVLTPHGGEFRNAFGLEPNEENAKKVARDLNAVILLKGRTDIITDGTRIKYNKEFHHESMTRGGTGDLLTGAVGGLLAKGVDPYHSACLASYVIGKSGLLAFKNLGYSYYTSEILNFIPQVINER